MSLPQPIEPIPASPLRGARPPALGDRLPKVQRRQRRSPAQAHRALAWEVTLRMTVNASLSLVALAALVKLVPYYQSQQQALQSLETSVTAAADQTARMKAEFTRYFDPTQTGQLIQERGGRESAQHLPIVWVDPASMPQTR
jgi:hypothetical protein